MRISLDIKDPAFRFFLHDLLVRNGYTVVPDGSDVCLALGPMPNAYMPDRPTLVLSPDPVQEPSQLRVMDVGASDQAILDELDRLEPHRGDPLRARWALPTAWFKSANGFAGNPSRRSTAGPTPRRVSTERTIA